MHKSVRTEGHFSYFLFGNREIKGLILYKVEPFSGFHCRKGIRLLVSHSIHFYCIQLGKKCRSGSFKRILQGNL